MTKADKARAALEARIDGWNELTAVGFDGPNTKLVRRHDGAGSQAFHKPGSQNSRNGGTRPGRHRRKTH